MLPNIEYLVWVPGHMGINGNEIADQIARQGSSHSLTGSEPATGCTKGCKWL